MRRLLAFLFAVTLAFSAAMAEDEDLRIEEIVEDVLLDEDGREVPLDADSESAGGEESASDSSGTADQAYSEEAFIPSRGSAYPAREGESGYWTLPMDITDEAAVWEMLMAPITVVDIGKKSGEKEQKNDM